MPYKNKEDKIAYMREYNKRPEVKKRNKVRSQRLDVVLKNKEYHQRPKTKELKKKIFKLWSQKPEVKEYRKEYSKEFDLMNMYGITMAKKKEMCIEQNNKCAICTNTFKNSRDTHTDHIHKYDSTGKLLKGKKEDVRGLLCGDCNTALGFCKDDINTLQKLILYLQSNIDNGEFKYSQHKQTQLIKLKLIKLQKYRCYTCDSLLKDIRHSHLDHNHRTTKIRQVLCGHCNHVLGFFKEDINIINNAIGYLKRYT